MNEAHRTLDNLAIGEIASIQEILDDPDGIDLEFRLLELGFEVGEDIQVIGRGPFGNPIACVSDGHIIAIRKQDAKRVVIGVIDSTIDDSRGEGGQ